MWITDLTAKLRTFGQNRANDIWSIRAGVIALGGPGYVDMWNLNNWLNSYVPPSQPGDGGDSGGGGDAGGGGEGGGGEGGGGE